MKNKKRFKKLLEDNFEGDAWLDISFLPTVAVVPAAEAAKNIYSLNAIWQIVHHVTCWRETLLLRIRDKKPVVPEHNFFEAVASPTEEAWQEQLQRLELSQKELMGFLKEKKEPDWDDKPSKGNYSSFELMLSILQHDAYHLGQIVLIKKLLDLPKAE
jgi:uncharacterized damage-inducible protein DinB